MPLTEEEKNYIIEKAVEILKASDKKDRLAKLREKVMANQSGDEKIALDEAVYSVLQAIEEVYGD